MAKTQNLLLDEGIAEFDQHLKHRPITENTYKAFVGDVRIFARYMQVEEGGGMSRAVPLASVTSENIRSFLAAQERSRVASNPKSIERRLTSLKVFFKWLKDAEYISIDPADRVAYKPLQDPLPEYLTDEQASSAVEAAKQLAGGDRLETRPLTAIMLVLETGIKKSECLALTVSDIEGRDQGGGAIRVLYTRKQMAFKNRTLPISDECLQAVHTHIRHFGIQDKLFDCTGRNLEYIFNRKVAPLAHLAALTFEMLRWTCAIRDYRSEQYSTEQLQVRYGLSDIGWLEMQAKLVRLIHPEDMVGDEQDVA
jgi:integrase/recombinase XerD